MDLSNLIIPEGSRKKRKRVGRGAGSGRGKTCGRGHKGQKSRSGAKIKPGFEGGQMPLIRRLPKRGFKNPNRIEYAVVNVEKLNVFQPNEEVFPEKLFQTGLIKGKIQRVKILGNGELKVPLIVRAHKFSKTAKEKITAIGGKIEVIQQ